MMQPSKYKSISTKELKAKTVTPLPEAQKVQVDTILNKLVSLIKKKYT